MKVHYYYPYKSDKPDKKYYIITKTEKKVYFGAAGYSDFTKTNKDEARKQRYIKRHENNEDWSKSGIDTAGFWSRRLRLDASRELPCGYPRVPQSPVGLSGSPVLMQRDQSARLTGPCCRHKPVRPAESACLPECPGASRPSRSKSPPSRRAGGHTTRFARRAKSTLHSNGLYSVAGLRVHTSMV